MCVFMIGILSTTPQPTKLDLSSIHIHTHTLHQRYYAKTRAYVSSSPEVQACNKLVRSREALVGDMVRGGYSAGEGEAGEDLRCLVS